MAELTTLGAGCFWGVEKAFKRKFGNKIRVVVGYAGGHAKNPTYQDVCTGRTGHAEVVQIEFDPKKVAYADLLDFFFRSHDPSSKDRQGGDTGPQYRSCILYHSDAQKHEAHQVMEAVKPHFGPKGIATTLEPVGSFYRAEDYHQDYLTSHKNGYECATHFERSWDKIIAESGGK